MNELPAAEGVPTPPAPPPCPLSVRAYARHRNTSHTAVQRAIKNGRLKASVQVDARGHAQIVDVALADAEWEANTDLSRAPGYVKERLAVPAPGVVPRVPSALSEASAREKHWRAQQAELEYRKDAGELLEAAPIEAALMETFTVCKTRLLGLPSKAKHALPHLTTADVRTLDDLVRQALEDLALPDLKPDPDA